MSGASVYAGPAAKPWTARAASKLSNLVARPHHMQAKVKSSIENSKTGRRPKMLPSGTHKMFERPNRRTLSYQRRQHGFIAIFVEDQFADRYKFSESWKWYWTGGRQDLKLEHWKGGGYQARGEICSKCIE